MPKSLLTALMNAHDLPLVAVNDSVPEWIQLLPAGVDGVLATADDRGPYHVTDAQTIISASFADNSRLPIDENHSTDLAAPQGQPAPARGWIVEMEARADGIWGRVEWTDQGADLVRSRAYREISPVILHNADNEIHSIMRASLVNDPNFRGMASLHQKEPEMGLRDLLIKALNLSEDATDDDIVKAVNAQQGDDNEPALQSAMGQISTALGLAEDAEPDAVVAAAQSAATGGGNNDLITTLQSTVTTLTGRIADLETGISTNASEAFYERALQERRAGVGPATRDHWISMHKQNPDVAEALVAGMATLDESGTGFAAPAPKDGTVALNAIQKDAAKAMGMSEADFADHLKEIGD